MQVKHRKWDLEQYISSLLKLPRVGSSELILAFLEATPDACALRKELADAKQQVQDAINQHEMAVNAQVKVDKEHDLLIIKLQKARDDLAQVMRQYQKGEEELAQVSRANILNSESVIIISRSSHPKSTTRPAAWRRARRSCSCCDRT